MKDTRIYNEYVTCSWCGYKKLCRFKNRKFICMACDIRHKEKVK